MPEYLRKFGLELSYKDNHVFVWRLDRYKIKHRIFEPTKNVIGLDFHPSNRIIGSLSIHTTRSTFTSQQGDSIPKSSGLS